MSPQLRVYLKTALDPCCFPERAVVIATANDPTMLGAPLLQRFKRLQFESGPKFRDGYNIRIERIWHEQMQAVKMPSGWEEWGFDKQCQSYSMRLALDRLQMYVLRQQHNAKSPDQRRSEADKHAEELNL